MTAVIATVRGVALSPGVSRNRRLYTEDNISRAVARAQARIAEGVRPVSMRTHHAAGDDSTRITGHLAELNLGSDGKARFAGVIEGTDAGRAIATLADNRDKAPSLKGVSIRGNWIGPVRTVHVDGYGPCETADDLEITGLDWTAEPGVDDAGVEDIEFTAGGAPQETVGDRHPITETAEEASVTITEQATATTEQPTQSPPPATPAAGTSVTFALPAPAARETAPAARRFADLGYRNGERRFPVDTLTATFESWGAFNDPDGGSSGYTDAQRKRVRQRLKAAALEHGAQVTAEGWLVGPAQPVTEAAGGVAEGWLGGDGSFSIRISNGPIDVCVSSWYVDPAQLNQIAMAAMAGACTALAAIDPDGDGDADAGAAESATTETSGSNAGEAAAVTEAAAGSTTERAGVVPAGDTSTTQEAAVSEPNDQQAAAPAALPSVTLSGDQFAQLLAAVGGASAAPAESAPAAQPAAQPVAQPAAAAQETAQPAQAVAETEDQRIARLVQEGIAAQMPGMRAVMAQEFVQAAGGIGRRGLSAAGATQVGESAAGVAGGPAGLPEGLAQKPLHLYDQSERETFDRYVGAAILRDPTMLPGATTG